MGYHKVISHNTKLDVSCLVYIQEILWQKLSETWPENLQLNYSIETKMLSSNDTNGGKSPDTGELRRNPMFGGILEAVYRCSFICCWQLL